MKYLSVNYLKTKVLVAFFLIFILSIAAFLRFEGLSRLGLFTYDQARDTLYIKRILVDYKFRLIGTQTSIPGVYTPPFYYYLMAPILLIFRFNPVGIDYATAFFNLIAIFLLYVCLSNLTKNLWLSLILSALYAFNPVIVSQSRFAWNPNTMPFFTLLGILALLKIHDSPKKVFNYLILFFALGMNINLHYSGIAFVAAILLSLPVIGIKKISWRNYFGGLGILFLLILPLFLFEVRHNFLIVNNIIKYLKFGAGGSIPSPSLLVGVWQKLSFLLGLPFTQLKIPVVFLGLIFLAAFIFVIKKKGHQKLIMLYLILIISTVISSLYTGGFFSFYLTLFYPLPFLVLGGTLSVFSEKKYIFALFNGFFLLMVLFEIKSSLSNVPEEGQDNFSRLMSVAKSLSQKIKSNDNFNLASLYQSEDRYDRNAVDYRYFLETYFKKSTSGWDSLDYENSADLYFISQVKDYDPLSSNVWEIQTFNPKQIKEKWEVEDVTIYHLIK